VLALARLSAHQGDAASTVLWLEKAFAAGWNDYAAVVDDPDFAIVRNCPG